MTDTTETDLLTRCPSLRSYVTRVASELGLDFEVRNFKTVVLTEPTQPTQGRRYRRDRIKINIARDGSVSSFPKGVEPDDTEAAAIKAEYANLDLPKSIKAPRSKAEDQREKLDRLARQDPRAKPCAKEDWFELLDIDRKEVVMCQQRVETDDGKYYVPWTWFSDGKWRQMEPDDALPLWKPDKERNKVRLMIHEGAKPARFVDRMLNSLDVDDRKMRAEHPLAEELSQFEHWGWIGGAPNPWRANWSEIGNYQGLTEVVIVTDNDLEGQKAIGPISYLLRFLQVPVWEVRFNDTFIEHFDFADPFPREFWLKDRYRGPRLNDLMRSASWVTKALPVKEGKGGSTPRYEARPSFLKQWVVSTTPPVFIHRKAPGRLLTAEEFNAEVAPFSDVKNTSDLIRREAAIKVNGIAYEPERKAGTITVEGELLFNTYTPTRIGRREGDATPFLNFMTHLFPDEKDRKHVMKWVATLIAHPDVRMKYGLLLISEEQGVGKGTKMEKILAPLVGRHNVSIPNEHMLTESSFNPWLARKRLVLVHEVYTGQSKKAYDSIKSALTDDLVTVNEKNKPEYIIRNWSHYVLSSNSFLALRLVKNDRRWFVPRVTEKKKTPAYWVEFNAWLVEGGLEIIHDWAHKYVAEHGHVGPGDDAPTSSAKEKLIKASRSDGQQLVFDLGLSVNESEKPYVLTDRTVRVWLCQKRGLNNLSDKTLESHATIRKELRSAGMTELDEVKVMGKRFSVFANSKAIDKARKAAADGQEAVDDLPTWKHFKVFELDSYQKIEGVIVAEEGEEDPQSGPSEAEVPF